MKRQPESPVDPPHPVTASESVNASGMLLLASLPLGMRAPPPARRSTVRCCAAPQAPPPPEQAPPPPERPAAAETKRTFSDGWSGAGRFADEDPLPLSFWLFGAAPRRAILPSLGSTAIALAANLWGSGSLLLSLAPEASRKQRLDVFYPVSAQPRYPYTKGYLDYAPGFKRYYDDSQRFEFRYPATYVQDQTVFLRNADAAYNQRMLDPTLGPTRARPRNGPEVAFGPAGESAAENLSVVIGGLEPGFSLRGTLGPPEEAPHAVSNHSDATPRGRTPLA